MQNTIEKYKTFKLSLRWRVYRALLFAAFVIAAIAYFQFMEGEVPFVLGLILLVMFVVIAIYERGINKKGMQMLSCPGCKNGLFYFLEIVNQMKKKDGDVKDMKYCPLCGQLLD